MRILSVVVLLLLSACYQVEGEAVPVGAGIRAEGMRDGLYRRPDGVTVAVRWVEDERAYRVAGGVARVRAAANGRYVVYYVDAARLAVVAEARDGDVVMLAPPPALEGRLLSRHGLALKAGPINRLSGPEASVRGYLDDLAGLAETVEAGRLVWLGPLIPPGQ